MFCCLPLLVFAQVGIGTVTPDSKLEIRSAGSSSATRSFHVKTQAGVTLFLVRDDGFVGIGTSSPGSNLDIKGGIRLSGSTSGYVGIAPAAAAGSTTYTLPSADGTNGQLLKTNGSGILSWTSDGGATNINALSDAKVEDGSIYLGRKPTTTSTAEYNISLGTTALYSITTGDMNIAIGKDALYTNTSGTNNIALGESSLYWHESGANNTAIGVRAQFWNKTAGNNTAIGLYSMYGGINSATGGDNTAVGANSMQSYTSGYSNVAIGMEALNKNTSGGANTAVGKSALYKNTSNSENTAVGASALYHSTGLKNTAVGMSALMNTSTGGLNTALGHAAGDLITTGNQNVIIGAGADPSVNSGINQIVIGFDARGQADNSVVLGNADVTAVYASQDKGATVYAGALDLSLGDITLQNRETISNATDGKIEVNATNTIISGNLGIGITTPNTNAVLDISSSSKGVLLPRLTVEQRDAISSPAEGLIIYNTSAGSPEIYAKAKKGEREIFNYSAGASTTGASTIWQEFTPLISGWLSSVSLDLEGVAANEYELRIHSGVTSTNLSQLDGGKIIGFTSVVMPSGANGYSFYEFKFSEPVFLKGNTKYWFRSVRSTGNSGSVRFNFNNDVYSSHSSYVGGHNFEPNFIMKFQPIGDAVWMPLK